MSREGEAIILAGGIGTRLKSVSGDIPKPMMPVGGRPFLEYLLKMLDVAGIVRVILSVCYRHKVICSHFGSKYNGMAISYSVEDHHSVPVVHRHRRFAAQKPNIWCY
jgi:NDP-sugar pyrophosphorylase family protein